jgi:hypothetical protein
MLHLTLLACLAPLSALQGAPQDGAVLSRNVRQLPQLGLEVTDERQLDPASGRILRTTRDQFGNAVDLDALVSREIQLRNAANAKMSPELAEKVAARPAGELVHVVFWLATPESPDFPVLMRDWMAQGSTPAQARQMALALARQLFEPANLVFAERLAAAGIQVDLVGEFWPDVFATLPAGEVARWAQDPAVELAFYAFTEGGPELQYAQGTMRTFNVHDQGISGANGSTKVLVNDCGEVTTTNPLLPPVIKKSTGSAQSHPSGVAGNICSNDAVNFGAARGLPQLYSADGCGSDAPAQAAWAWGLQQGIDVGNCSWWNGSKGSIVFLDRFFDYTIRNFSVMLFKSNGNQGTSGTPYATSPGNGYNMISSGAYTDGNTVNWSNDAMASYSSYWNPVEGHEKPEVATPGDNLTTTGVSGSQNFNGTSSASPLSCGVSVLLTNQDPALLGSMPGLKAALMVGAWHNVEGAAVLSDKDGAGGVHAAASHALVRDGKLETGIFTAASFPAGTYDKQVQLYAGDETRLIALWFSDPDAAYSTDPLKMDLDLAVLDPQNQVVASSASSLNPFELVQFTPAQNGLYTVRLTRQKFLGTSEPYAIAWSSRQDAAVADVTFTGSPTIGSVLQVNFRERYDPNVGFIGVASFGTLPSLIPLQGGWILPLELDRYARFTTSGAVPSFAGTLDATGRATGFLPLPNHPAFIGMTVYVSMFTHTPGNVNAVRGTAPAASFVIQ